MRLTRSGLSLAIAAIGAAIGGSMLTSSPPEAADPQPGRLVVAVGAPRIDGWLRGRLLVLDAIGRTLVQGPQEGLIGAVGVCPGARLLFEVEEDDRRLRRALLRVRRIDTLKLVRTVPLRMLDEDGSFFGAVACHDRAGRRGALFISEDSKNDDKSMLMRLAGRRLELVHRGDFSDAALTRGRAFLTRGFRQRREIVAVGLRSGRERVVARFRRRSPTYAPVALSPNGHTLAAVVQRRQRRDGDTRPVLHLFDVRPPAARPRAITMRAFQFPIGMFDRGFQERPDPPPPCPPHCASGDPVWLSNETVAFVPHVAQGRDTDLFTRRGTPRGRLPGLFGDHPALLGGRLYALAREPSVQNPDDPTHLRAAGLRGGPAQRLVTLGRPSEWIVGRPSLLTPAP